MKTLRIVATLIAVLALGLLFGCAQPQPPAPTKVPAAETPTADQTMSRQIRRALDLADPQNAGKIVVEVAEGVVTLRGTASDLRAAWRAVAAAQSVAGVKKVNNNLLVNAP